MSPNRLGLSYSDPDRRRAEQDRDVVAAVGDLQGIEVGLTSPATPSEEFAVVHNFRTHVPRAVQVLRSTKGGVVYASRLADWDKRRIFVKCTTGADELLLWVR